VTQPSEHFVVDGGEFDLLPATLDGCFSTRVEPGPARTETYHDTFDWRLHRNGARLVLRRRRRALLASFENADGSIEGELKDAPCFARDLPAGPLRDALGPILTVRRILPVIRVRRRTRTVEVLNEDRKIVARVSADEIEVAAPEDRSRWTAVTPCWTVRPLRGYDSEARAIGERLANLPNARRDPRTELDRLLATIDREAGAYSSKFRLDLTGKEPAGVAVRRVLAKLIETVRLNEPGTLADLDSEFLHDFRVAIRRTRSCIGQMKTALPASRIEPFKKEFAWLGEITGPTRDLDVFLIDLDRWSDDNEAWAPLLDLVRRDQRREQKKMAAQLRTPRYRALLADWAIFLESEPAPGEAPESERPIVEAATERIARRYTRMVARGRKLDARRATRALHRLRIEGKKLRYLLEFFRTTFPAETVEPAIGALKRLQDNLGEFNDLQVQQAALPLLARRLGNSGSAPAETLLLIGRLLERLVRREREVRRDFLGEFEHFASDEFARLIG
jgi:CHAD domain-containing protein